VVSTGSFLRGNGRKTLIFAAERRQILADELLRNPDPSNPQMKFINSHEIEQQVFTRASFWKAGAINHMFLLGLRALAG